METPYDCADHVVELVDFVVEGVKLGVDTVKPVFDLGKPVFEGAHTRLRPTETRLILSETGVGIAFGVGDSGCDALAKLCEFGLHTGGDGIDRRADGEDHERGDKPNNDEAACDYRAMEAKDRAPCVASDGIDHLRREAGDESVGVVSAEAALFENLDR